LQFRLDDLPFIILGAELFLDAVHHLLTELGRVEVASAAATTTASTTTAVASASAITTSTTRSAAALIGRGLGFYSHGWECHQ
jgi:hypothetical protein